MKKLCVKFGVVVFAVAAGSLPTFALTETVDGITWTYTVSGGKASVGGGASSATAVPTTTTGAITIPSSIGGYPVTSIGEFAFSDCRGLTSVTIPDSVTSIGDRAFSGCSGLASVVMPNNVTSIGMWAFSGCSGLTSVSIPDGVTIVKWGTFEFCSGLASVTIPDGVTIIEDMAFYCCRGLTSVTIPDSVTYIDELAFSTGNELDAVFMGQPSSSVMSLVWAASRFYYPASYEVAWRNFLASYGVDVDKISLKVLSSKIRETDHAIIDINYVVNKKGSVIGRTPTTNGVRALAFEDGARSFAKVVRPETFANDTDGNPTAQNVGDNVAANVTNTLSWKVSSDWAVRLAKVKFEVLVCNAELVSMETMIIPASDKYGKMQISWNRHTNDQIFDALMWLYADKAAGLTLENGALKAGGKTLSNGTEIVDGKAAAEFVYRAMGFDGVLSDDLLNYVNEETRLGLSPDGVRQYAYKMVEE